MAQFNPHHIFVFQRLCVYNPFMETIRELLNRIRWDKEFGQGTFDVGVFDRVSDTVLFYPLEELQFEKGNHFSFTICLDGQIVTIPFHRIRQVRENGQAIWKR